MTIAGWLYDKVYCSFGWVVQVKIIAFLTESSATKYLNQHQILVGVSTCHL